jgi:uncharacterized OsmC-like protein
MTSARATVETTDDGTSGKSSPLSVDLRNSRTGQRQRFEMDAFTGAHLLHLAVAGCVYNDLFREAMARGIRLTQVRVSADGGFAGEPCASTGITYDVHVEGDATEAALKDLVAHVEAIAEIPSAIRLSGEVRLGRHSVVSATT